MFLQAIAGDVYAFVEDPDRYRIELLVTSHHDGLVDALLVSP